jgi:hypothetical protein
MSTSTKVVFADKLLYGLISFETNLHGYDAFTLGGVDTSCFCGWTEHPQGVCNIPLVICQEKSLLPKCLYVLGSDTGSVFTQELIDDWTSNGDWSCPENDLSDSWGIIPTDNPDDWIQASTIASEKKMSVDLPALLTFGLAGLRIGNIESLALQAKMQGVHPGQERERENYYDRCVCPANT